MFTLDTYHIIALLIALLFVSVLLLSYLGYGRDTQGFLKFLVLFPFILTTVSIFIPFDIIFYLNYVFVILGIFLGCKKVNRLKLSLKWSGLDKIEKFLLVIVLIQLISTFMGATVLHGEGAVIDAMTYHVGAAKEWALHMSGPHLNTNNPESFTASYYEYFQYSVMLLFRPLFITLKDIEKTHYEFLAYTLLLSAQIFTTLFATVFIPMLIRQIYKIDLKFVLIMILLLLGMKNMTWIWRTAKNDAYPLFCALLSYSIIIESRVKNNWKSIFLAFFVLGIGIGAKFTNVYPMLFILLYFFVKEYKSFEKRYLMKAIIVAGIAGICGLLPILLRNYLETGNPMYPTSSSLFPNVYLSDKTELFHHLYSHATTWFYAKKKLLTLFTANPYMIVLVIGLVFYRKYIEIIFLAVFLIFISKITGERFMWRQMSLLLFFVIIMSKNIFDELRKRKILKYKYSYLILSILVITLAQFKPERIVKYPLRNYFVTIASAMPNQYYAWNELLEENLITIGVNGASTNHSAYFSRLPASILSESREEYRYNY